jgi:hypothetical protein
VFRRVWDILMDERKRKNAPGRSRWAWESGRI